MTNQVVENVFTVAALEVNGVPEVMHPTIGDDMSDGVIITKSNQKDYAAPFIREEGQCKLVELEADFIELTSSKLTIAKEFKSKEEAEEYVKGLSSVTIMDNINGLVYTATVMGVADYDIN